MIQLDWWLVEKLSRVLEPGERDVVRGDFAESGESGPEAVRDVLGLLLRRQAALWSHPRPWLVLIGVIVPAALLLSLISRRVADGNAVYSWMYFNNWDWQLIQQRAFWIILAQTIALVLPDLLSLMCLSWTMGIVIRALSGITAPINSAWFAVASLFGALVIMPRYTQLQLFSFQSAIGPDALRRHAGDHDAVFSGTFYKVTFPLLIQIVLVLLPALWGMYKQPVRAAVPRILRAMLWTPALGILAVLGAMQAIWWTGLTTHNWAWLRRGWETPPLTLAAVGPIVYILSAAVWERWRRAIPQHG